MTTIIIVNCGYVESSRACLGTAFETDEAYSTEVEAIKSLSGWLLTKYQLENAYHQKHTKKKKCCKKNAGSKFCKDCGSNLEEEPFDSENFAYWISTKCCGTADGWGDGWGDALYAKGDKGFQPVTPDWEPVYLSSVLSNLDRTCVLQESGEEHLAEYARASVEGNEPEIPSWYEIKGFGGLKD